MNIANYFESFEKILNHFVISNTHYCESSFELDFKFKLQIIFLMFMKTMNSESMYIIYFRLIFTNNFNLIFIIYFIGLRLF
jgi:hypothetical protein